MTDVKVVTPQNIGAGIVWDTNTSKYKVDTGSGIKIVSNKVTLDVMPPTQFDLRVRRQQNVSMLDAWTIKYPNGVIELCGTVILRLPDKPEELVTTHPNAAANLAVHKQWLKDHYSPTMTQYGHPQLVQNPAALGLTKLPSETMYLCELGYTLDVNAIAGITRVLSVTLTPGDIYGIRRETAWVNYTQGDSPTMVPMGVSTYFTKGQNSVPLHFSIKGLGS